MAVASPSPVKILSDLGYEIWEIENDADLRSALIEAINTLSMGNPSDQRIPILQEAVKNIQRSKFKERSINVGKLMNRKASSAQKISPQKLLPAASESGEGNQTLLTENLAKRLNNIAENLNALSRVLKQQFNLDKQSAQQSKIDKDEEAKKAREGELEGGKGKGILGKTFDAFTKPFGNFFNAIIRWLNNVLLGTGALALLKWLQDPENQARIQAFWDFLTDTLPKIITEFFNALQNNWLANILFPGLATATMSGLSSGSGKKGDDGDEDKGDGNNTGGPTATATATATEFDVSPAFKAQSSLVTESGLVTGEVKPLDTNWVQQLGNIWNSYWADRKIRSESMNSNQVYAHQLLAEASSEVDWGALFDWGLAAGAVAIPFDAGVAGDAVAIANLLRNGRISWSLLRRFIGKEALQKLYNYIRPLDVPEPQFQLSSVGNNANFQSSFSIASRNQISPPLEGSNGTQIVDLRTASAAVGGSSGSGSASSGPSHIKGAVGLFAASILNIGNAG